MMTRLFLLGLISVAMSSAAAAQEEQTRTAEPSQVATSSVGKTGQRQTREITSEDAGIKPMARINDRIQNRVQSRIRNRIDRFYDPQANALSPFKDAGEEARTAGRKLRR